MNSPLRVLVFGDPNTVPSVRETLALESGLRTETLGIHRPFAGLFAFRGCDVAYGVLSSASWKVFARARRAGCLTVNHWIGTDVLETLRSPALRENLAKAPIDLHVAVAPWLCEELKSIGIGAAELPIVPPGLKPAPVSLPKEHAVISYASPGREGFYGVEGVCELARRFPAVPFHLCGGARRAAEVPGNLRLWGRVGAAQMESLWNQASVLLRMPEHDGLSKMVLEGLARGREVVWNYPFEGARLARTTEEAARALLEIFSSAPRINERGWPEIRGKYSPGAVAAEAQAIFFRRLDPAGTRK